MATITVKQDGSGDHTLIQNAINSASAHDTIEIQDSETYYWPQSSSVQGTDNLHAYPPPGVGAGNAAAGFNPDDWGTGHPGYYSYFISASIPLTIQAGTASDGTRYTPTWSGRSGSASGDIMPRNGIIYGPGLTLKYLDIKEMCSASAPLESTKFGKNLYAFTMVDGGDTIGADAIPSCSLYYCTASYISGNLYLGKGLYNTFESCLFHSVKWTGITVNNNNAAAETIVNNCVFYLIGSGNLNNVAQEESDTTNRYTFYSIGPKSKFTHNVVQECGYSTVPIYCYVGSGAATVSFNIINAVSASTVVIRANVANDNCLHNNSDLAEYAGGARNGTKRWWHDDTSGADAGGIYGDSETGNLLGINPLFLNASTASASDQNNRDYRLDESSPCINTATGSIESFDADGVKRMTSVVGAFPSIGAFEYVASGSAAYSAMTKDAQYDVDTDFTVNIYKNLHKQYQTRKNEAKVQVAAPPPFSRAIKGPATLRGRTEAHSASIA